MWINLIYRKYSKIMYKVYVGRLFLTKFVKNVLVRFLATAEPKQASSLLVWLNEKVLILLIL